MRIVHMWEAGQGYVNTANEGGEIPAQHMESGFPFMSALSVSVLPSLSQSVPSLETLH